MLKFGWCIRMDTLFLFFLISISIGDCIYRTDQMFEKQDFLENSKSLSLSLSLSLISCLPACFGNFQSWHSFLSLLNNSAGTCSPLSLSHFSAWIGSTEVQVTFPQFYL